MYRILLLLLQALSQALTTKMVEKKMTPERFCRAFWSLPTEEKSAPTMHDMTTLCMPREGS
jgi:hypothetical protein